jgi:hypothetical protein
MIIVDDVGDDTIKCDKQFNYRGPRACKIWNKLNDNLILSFNYSADEFIETQRDKVSTYSRVGFDHGTPALLSPFFFLPFTMNIVFILRGKTLAF